MLSFVLACLLFTSARSISVIQNVTEKGQLFVTLNWSDDEEKNYPTFRVFRSKNGDEFQSISTIDLERGDEVVKVLNVYPIKNVLTKYYDKDKNLIRGVTEQSGSLKVFMEGGYIGTDFNNLSYFEPYGQVQVSAKKRQVITVTPMSFHDFHTTMSNDRSKIWDYDVIYFGSWDSLTAGTGNSPTDSEIQLLEEYLAAGYGVLMGHDSIVTPDTGFGKLAKKLGIVVKTTTQFYYHSTIVQMKREGTLSQYPWILGNTMIIPDSHTTCQFAQNNKDIWFEFINGTIPHDSPQYIEAMKNGNGVFYLTSTNNIAMIQTGHSNGESSSDERKILANTLFYLKQRSSNTYVNDFNVVDEKKPDAPIEVTKEITTDAQKHIKLSLKLKGKDNGDRYDYLVKGYSNSEGLQYTSTNTTISIISGLKHFAYLFDDKATTTADKLVNTATVVAIGGNSGAAKVIKGDVDSSTNGNNQNVVNGIVEGEGTIEIENIEQLKPSGTTSNTFKMYLHAACVDNKNLVSEITNIAVDITIPVDPPTTIEVIKPPTEVIKPPTEVIKPPTEVVKPPTEVIKTPTEVVIVPPTEVVTSTVVNNDDNGSEQNKGESGKKSNTGSIIGAVVGVVAGLAGAAAATAILVNVCKPPIPIVPFFGSEEEEEEDFDEDYDLNTNVTINPDEDAEYNIIQNDDDIDPYENRV